MKNDSMLYRQVHPSFIQGDTISTQVFTSQVFKPTTKDSGLLSVYSGEVFSPEDSHIHYSEDNKKSSGVVAVTKEECKINDLPVIDDNIPFVGHCSINYNSLSNGQISKKSKKLKVLAENRGWLFRPE